jgi:hypothetical protein
MDDKFIEIENILIVIFIAFCTLVVYFGLRGEIHKLETPKYKVYYEYNITNRDTIPVDTVYVKL